MSDLAVNSESGGDASEARPADSIAGGRETAGSRLRAARLARGLSLEQIAETLRFSAHQIAALERDDHSRLPGGTLVRGMIRGYAKLLKISPEPVLAELDVRSEVGQTDVRPPSNIGMASAGTKAARISRAVLWVLLIGIGLFAVVAVYVNMNMDVGARGTSEAGGVTPMPVKIVDVPATPLPALEVAATVANPGEANATAVTAVTGDAVMPPAVLVVEFDELSWVEVTDASQSIVFRGEYPKGTRQVVDGKAPFQIWIGRASAVRVSYGARSIDLKPYTRENVARLSIE